MRCLHLSLAAALGSLCACAPMPSSMPPSLPPSPGSSAPASAPVLDMGRAARDLEDRSARLAAAVRQFAGGR